MKKKLFFMPILLAGFIYFLFNLISLVTMNSENRLKYALLFSILILCAYLILTGSIVFHIFKPQKFTLLIIWCACIIFTSVFFVDLVLTFSKRLNSYIQVLSGAIHDEIFATAIREGIFACRLRIAAYSILLACSVFTFGTLAVREIYRTRPVKAE